MALLSVIRRWAFREGMPIREISRRTGLSRNTIRKYLRAGTVEPKFKVPERPSTLDPFAETLSGWLRIEAGRPRKQTRTAKQMHADLVALGYEGSYGRVAAFARAWKANRQRDAQTREHANPWGLVPFRVGSRLTGRGWLGVEAGVACEAGGGAGARRDHGDRGRVSRARRGGWPGGPWAEARRGEATHGGAPGPDGLGAGGRGGRATSLVR